MLATEAVLVAGLSRVVASVQAERRRERGDAGPMMRPARSSRAGRCRRGPAVCQAGPGGRWPAQAWISRPTRLGQLLGDGLDDVALHGLPEGAPAGRAQQEQVGAVGDGHVEDGVGDVAGDAVEQPRAGRRPPWPGRGGGRRAPGPGRPRPGWGSAVGPIGVTARWRMNRMSSSAWRFLHSFRAKSMSRGLPWVATMIRSLGVYAPGWIICGLAGRPSAGGRPRRRSGRVAVAPGSGSWRSR